MRKLVVLSFITLDGIMQAPGGKGEDPSNGFDLEGWTFPFFDEMLGSEMGKQMTPPFDLLLGRKTYDIFASYWPRQGDADPFKHCRKYVVTNREVESGWEDTVPVKGDVIAGIQNIKKQDGPMLQVHGSSKLIQTLLGNDLVDEMWLKIFPVVLGKGKRLFEDGVTPASLKMMESKVSPSGVIIASYKRDGEVKLGSLTPDNVEN